jgi:hypothetical protein
MTAVTQTAASALKTYLESVTSAAVLAYNSARRPELYSKTGNFVFPGAGSYWLGATYFANEEIVDWSYDSLEVNWLYVDLAAGGSKTAAQVVAATLINSYPPEWGILEATSDNRVVLKWNSSNTAPLRLVNRLPSNVGAGGYLANAIFGWDAGGEIVSSPELVAPTMRSICDGFPAFAPDMQAGMWLIIGDREASPVGDSSLRRDVWEVRLPLHVMLPVRADAHHRSRTAIAGAVGMLEDLLLSTAGRYLGRQSTGDVVGVEVLSERIEAQPIVLEEVPHAYFDVATIDLLIRIHQRH